MTDKRIFQIQKEIKNISFTIKKKILRSDFLNIFSYKKKLAITSQFCYKMGLEYHKRFFLQKHYEDYKRVLGEKKNSYIFSSNFLKKDNFYFEQCFKSYLFSISYNKKNVLAYMNISILFFEKKLYDLSSFYLKALLNIIDKKKSKEVYSRACFYLAQCQDEREKKKKYFNLSNKFSFSFGPFYEEILKFKSAYFKNEITAQELENFVNYSHIYPLELQESFIDFLPFDRNIINLNFQIDRVSQVTLMFKTKKSVYFRNSSYKVLQSIFHLGGFFFQIDNFLSNKKCNLASFIKIKKYKVFLYNSIISDPEYKV